jgi:hypothetical protein
MTGEEDMGVRETINRKPAVAGGISVAVALLAIGVVAYQLMANGGPRELPTARIFVSTDDGGTFQAVSSSQIPPFDLDGREAVIAKVYECEGKRFVGYLQKYTPEGKKRLQAMQAEQGDRAANAAVPAGTTEADVLYKKPGGKEWFALNNPKSAEVLNVRCPEHGKMGLPVQP